MVFLSTLLGLTNTEINTEKLQLIITPTLVLWGENDPVIPIKYAQSFVSGINDCIFYKMVGCGHTPYVEKPKKFFEIISDFLN
jgi:pimeloyl-ACP methyl ester carboxylesterase